MDMATVPDSLNSDYQQVIEATWQYCLNFLNANTREIYLPGNIQAAIGEEGIRTLVDRYRQYIGQPVEAYFIGQIGQYRLAPSSSNNSPPPPSGQNNTPIPPDPPEPPARIAEPSNRPRGKKATIPRPRNCFILYREYWNAFFKTEFPDETNIQRSKRIAAQWHAEPANVIDEWKGRALHEKIQHALAHPDYKYAPRKPSEKQRRQSRKAAMRASIAAAAVQPLAPGLNNTELLKEIAEQNNTPASSASKPLSTVSQPATHIDPRLLDESTNPPPVSALAPMPISESRCVSRPLRGHPDKGAEVRRQAELEKTLGPIYNPGAYAVELEEFSGPEYWVKKALEIVNPESLESSDYFNELMDGYVSVYNQESELQEMLHFEETGTGDLDLDLGLDGATSD